MKVLIINMVCGVWSTGRICCELAEKMEAEGHEVKIAYGQQTVPEKYWKYAVRIGSDFEFKCHFWRTIFFDSHGFGSGPATDRFLKWAEEYDPDMVWLHNLHGSYIHVGKLFAWIKSRPHMQVKWTLHDCWAFTGHCAHFEMAKCERWKTQCHHCPLKQTYPISKVFDNSRNNYKWKKAAFTGVKDMTLIVPSKWLANLVKQSFLKEYPMEVHYNTIDTSVFKPTPSDFKQKNGIGDKTVVLGVASHWGKAKGLDDFFALREMLDDSYAIVLVGLTAEQAAGLPEGIIGITRTNNTKELAEIYTAADVFVNPTYQDNYPTVNLESIACGTPVITYNTGGSPESAAAMGTVVDVGDVSGLKRAIEAMREDK